MAQTEHGCANLSVDEFEKQNYWSQQYVSHAENNLFRFSLYGCAFSGESSRNVAAHQEQSLHDKNSTSSRQWFRSASCFTDAPVCGAASCDVIGGALSKICDVYKIVFS